MFKILLHFLKNIFKHSVRVFFVIVLLSACSTKKNTWLSRNYQALNTRFNVYFNGMNSYNDGIKNIQKSNKEDYSVVIPMYPISHHSNTNSAVSNMDLTIEKCRKAIKLHSIKVKPQKDYKKANLPEYKLWLTQQEFNPALNEAWLLLAKAEFHKGDFLGSVGTFSYIIRHYATDKSIEVTCQLWIARAYGEMGWIYEAEQVLTKINQNNLKGSNIALFASVNADLLLKKHLYKEAIPFLELALLKEKDVVQKQRFEYILAQLYHITNDDKSAYATFSKLLKLNPPYEMDFNARISRAQLNQGNVSSIRKELQSMLKLPSNKEYLDQLYFALGNTFLIHNDTLKAIDNYKLSVEKSTRKGIDKAVTLITLGDIYYIKRNYAKAQPCYDEASKIITNEHDDYSRVTRRAEMLSELVTQSDIVNLQDSLQRLSALPESKRLEIVKKIIEKLMADEKAAAEKIQKEKQAAIQNQDDNFGGLPPIGGGNPAVPGEWYFYNADVMRNGEVEFVKKWGNRKLEDNWRRTSKSTTLFTEQSTVQKAAKDSTDTISTVKVLMDNKKPEFYLRQIPVSPLQMAKSTATLGNALYSMGQIYKDKIVDIPMAIATFNSFCVRFATDERVADAYFNIYLMYTKQDNQKEANVYRLKLINEFPNSKYQKILAQPDYTARLERMYKEQDSIYSLTYKAYNESDFATVYRQVAYVKQHFPLSTLMPKFLFINALSVGKKEKPALFKTELDSLIANYPQSDVSAMAKDILALINQGQEAKNGTSSGSLITRRDENAKVEMNEILAQQFSADKHGKHRILLLTKASKDEMNKLLYNLASFNFSRFMIKDFDLQISKLDSILNAMSVTNFESFDEAVWYENSLKTDETLERLFTDLKIQKVIISDDNFSLFKNGLGLKEYLSYSSNTQSKLNDQKIISNLTSKSDKSETSKQQSSKNKIDAKVSNDPISSKNTEKHENNKIENTTILKPTELKPDLTVKSPPSISKKDTIVAKPSQQIMEQPKAEPAVLFKGLFEYKANEAHFVAIYVASGSFDFAKVKASLDTYNAQNYSLMNLKVRLETLDKLQVIIIGSLANAQIAKSYLLRMVKEKTLFEGLKAANYRNLLGSQKNLNTLIQQNALNQYFEFMQEYYLK